MTPYSSLASHFTPLLRSALLGLSLLAPLAASAQEAQPMPAVSRAQAKEESAAVNKAATPAEAAVIATGEKPARELTAAEKEAAITRADAITRYDAGKVRGMARPWQVHYQKAASPVMANLTHVHNFVQVIITVISIVVLALLVYVCVRFRARRNPHPNRFAHNTLVEIAWTLVPILILVAIGIPSVRAHYFANSQEAINEADMTLKVVGNQWYWSYEYPDYGIKFDSNILKDDQLEPGEPRLLAVDNPLVIPVGKRVRVQLTSADVIHDWALPAFGVKQDTVPGRLNETWFTAEEEGIYYGQCSELCGKFHGFMPIEIHVVSPETFDAWVAGAKLKFAGADHIQLALND